MVESISSMEVQSQGQKVVLAHDASKGVRVSSLKWVLDGFLLKAGDMFTLLSVVYQIQHPMGYMMRIDSSMFGVSQMAIDDEVATKKKEYEDNVELAEISKLYETQKVDFKIEFVAGSIPKNVVVEASKKLNATWVILDRSMKRDDKYFLEKLSCGISTMKRNGAIIKVRGPKLSRIQNPTRLLSNDEMLVVDDKVSIEEAHNGEDLFSIELESSCTSSMSTRTSISDTSHNNHENSTKEVTCDHVETVLTPEEKVDQNKHTTCNDIRPTSAWQSSMSTSTNMSDAGMLTLDNNQKNSTGEVTCDHVENVPTSEEKLQLDHNKCTICNDIRPTSAWQNIKFSYLDLADATNRFSPESLIHRGETEVCYHGILKDTKLHVIIKEQKDTTKYNSEMKVLKRTRHENVIMLLGTCWENHRLLVFEYPCGGSLDQHLSHQNSRPTLTWLERINIAIGTSKGLFHLHGNNIIHGDMRPKNIFLTHHFVPLIAGFALSSIENESHDSLNHNIIGTLGYLAPEYKERGKATTKTDVYAFGMILLQLVTGLSPTDTRLEGQSLIKRVGSLLQERKFSELIEPGIAYDTKQVTNIVRLAIKCVRKDPYRRLSMEEVMYILDYIKDEKTSNKGQRGDEIGEVKVNRVLETVFQNEHDFDENLNYGGMTTVPKQAKHFYQGAHI